MEQILKALSNILLEKHHCLALAESCTGGLLAKSITDLPGSSDWFERGLVTYSNQAKIDLLGVQVATLEQYGAVSEAVANEMAKGTLIHSPAQYGIGITGIAGPGGGSKEKPVGTVCFGWAKRTDHHCEIKSYTTTQVFSGDRCTVRHAAAEFAIEQLIRWI